jgi:hypothetical protein
MLTSRSGTEGQAAENAPVVPVRKRREIRDRTLRLGSKPRAGVAFIHHHQGVCGRQYDGSILPILRSSFGELPLERATRSMHAREMAVCVDREWLLESRARNDLEVALLAFARQREIELVLTGLHFGREALAILRRQNILIRTTLRAAAVNEFSHFGRLCDECGDMLAGRNLFTPKLTVCNLRARHRPARCSGWGECDLSLRYGFAVDSYGAGNGSPIIFGF